MTDLTRIDLFIQTSAQEGAETGNETVYLGICGREFCCDTKGDDFKTGATQTFTFGDGSNAYRPVYNDPRKPQLILEDVDRFPVYIRHDQRNSSAWFLEYARVHLNGSGFPQFESRLQGEPILLGYAFGEYYYLHRRSSTG
jgi:hypothetical protein